MSRTLKIIFACLVVLMLTACAHRRPPLVTRPSHPSQVKLACLEQGERYFKKEYYKKAMHILLPLACDGMPEAQYAVGYMYYYGLGVAQDTFVGYFWIERSASRHFYPAVDALRLIDTNKNDGDKIPNVDRPKMTQ